MCNCFIYRKHSIIKLIRKKFARKLLLTPEWKRHQSVTICFLDLWQVRSPTVYLFIRLILLKVTGNKFMNSVVLSKLVYNNFHIRIVEVNLKSGIFFVQLICNDGNELNVVFYGNEGKL